MNGLDELESFEKFHKVKDKDLSMKYGRYGCKKLNKRNKKNSSKRNYKNELLNHD